MVEVGVGEYQGGDVVQLITEGVHRILEVAPGAGQAGVDKREPFIVLDEPAVDVRMLDEMDALGDIGAEHGQPPELCQYALSPMLPMQRNACGGLGVDKLPRGSARTADRNPGWARRRRCPGRRSGYRHPHGRYWAGRRGPRHPWPGGSS